MLTFVKVSCGIVAAVYCWLIAASAIYLLAANKWDLFVFPFHQWLQAASYWQANWYMTLCVCASAGLPTTVPMICLFGMLRRKKRLRRPLGGGLQPIEPGVTENHGKARWATRSELVNRFGGNEGCLLGAFDQTADSRLLFDDMTSGPMHSLVFSGPGSFKTTSAVTRIYRHKGPRVVFDPSCEIGPIMTEALERTGHVVKTIGIKNPGINALDWIDVTNPEADVHIRTAVDHIYDENNTKRTGDASKDPFWSQWGKSLVTCLMAHMLFDKNPAGPKTLASLREGIGTPEDTMQNLLSVINTTSNSRMARDIAGGLMGMRAAQTFSGIYSNSFAATEWLSVGAYANMVSGSAMKTSDILNDDTVVFVQTPLRSLLATPAIGRAVMGALFNALYHADGKNTGHPTMFEIDEAWTIGKMDEIKLGYTTARKYNGVIQTLWQSEGQLDGIWGKDDAKMLRDSASWRAYGAVQDGDVAEKISRDFGEYGIMAFSEGEQNGRSSQGLNPGSRSRGSNTNKHEIKRRLVKADEITRASADELFILFRDFPNPIHCYAAPYFRYTDINEQMTKSRFVRNAA